MMSNINRNTVLRRVLLAGVMALGIVASPSQGAETIDPDAERILRAMSKYVGSLSAVSVLGDVDNEIVTLDGQKLQLSASATLILQRPGRIYVHRRGSLAEVTISSDGKKVTIYNEKTNIYVQTENHTGTIDGAVRALEFETGLDFPAGDLFFTDPYPGLMTDVRSGVYFGTTYVNGVECHHLAFRASKVDWQIWIRTGNAPVPMKYVITSKWVTGAPEFSVRFRDWNTKPQIDAGRFAFAPSAGARKLDSITVNEAGELVLEETK